MSAEELNTSNKIQYLALACNTLINFGDAVELFLPAVITQPVSCELGISMGQEHIAALTLYISIAVMSIISIPMSNKIGRRALLLLGMYIAIFVTVICSVASNYLFLILSRAFLGCALALNLSTSGVYMAEICNDKKFFTSSITIMATAFSLGGGWCGLLGYLFLERIGWRYFILLTSLPIFIPPLVLLQFYLPETLNERAPSSENKPLIGSIPTIKSVVIRVVKLSLYIITFGFIYSGHKLLIPVIMRAINIKNEAETPCGSIHGIQFLAITVIFGGCHIIGRFLSYLFQHRLSTSTIFTVCSIVCFPVMVICCVFPHNTVVLFVGIAVIQTIYSAAANEVNLCSNDKEFFSQKYIAAASGCLICMVQAISVTADVVSEVSDYETTLITHAVFAGLNLFISLLFMIKE